ncbi:MAG: phosphatase PAP2 family protein [Chitinispirillales bacterium]|nr:phosphatase PAP2 family protein [Chitinispirillales bacterium]
MITNIDYALFVFFNTAFSNPFFDLIFPVITKESNLMYSFFIALAVYVAVSKDKILAAKRAGIAILLFVISDAFSHRILKAFFERPRPCNSNYFVNGVHVMFPQCHFLLGRRGAFSFPSNHAVNLSAIALLWSIWCPKAKYIFISIALFLIFTRVYCGVHYPLDLFFGTVFGAAFGYMAYIGTKPLLYNSKKDSN